jgi:hypothetical protein
MGKMFEWTVYKRWCTNSQEAYENGIQNYSLYENAK